MSLDETRKSIIPLVEKLYGQLNVELDAGPVLLPSSGIYKSIFAWDSGWHYFWLKYMDHDRARAELRTLFSQQYDNGKVCHEIVPGTKEGYPLKRRLLLWMLRHSFDWNGNSWFIDPPVYLLAALDCIKVNIERYGITDDAINSENRFFLGAVLRKLEWIHGNRCSHKMEYPFNRLPALLHPLESGTDFSPQFDQVYGNRYLLMVKSVTMLKRLSRIEWSVDEAVASGKIPLLYDITYVSFYLLVMYYLHDLLQLLRERGFQYEFAHARIPLTRDQVVEMAGYLYNSDTECFDGFFTRKGSPVPLKRQTLGSFLLYLRPVDHSAFGAVPASAVRKWLGRGKPFFMGNLPSFNPFHGEAKDLDNQKLSSLLWRGPCSWMNMNYCLVMLFKRYGLEEEAQVLMKNACKYIMETGPCEYFHVARKEGGGAFPFSWNGLVLSMLELIAEG